MSERTSRNLRPFNGPLETGLRSLFVLDAVVPASADLQRLVYYDYLLLHARDAGSDQESVHPAIPYRSGEILVRRQLIERGLGLMTSKELLVKQVDQAGITYAATKLCRPFLEYLATDYANALRVASQWVALTFAGYGDAELSGFMYANIGRWGAEFKFDSLLRGTRNAG